MGPSPPPTSCVRNWVATSPTGHASLLSNRSGRGPLSRALTAPLVPSLFYSLTLAGNWLPSCGSLPSCMARLNVSFATTFTPFRQCDKCHVLSHSTERCPRPTDYVCCHLCGHPKHTAATYAQNCPNKARHRGLECDCPIKCFNCVYAGKSGEGHLVVDDFCPLKKNMRQEMNEHAANPAPPTAAATMTTLLPPARVDA